MMSDTSYAKSITLPEDNVFRNIQNAKRFAIDIGGSLTKLAYYSTITKKRFKATEPTNQNNGSVYNVTEEEEECEQLHFLKFETKYIETCVDFIQQNLLSHRDQMIDKCIKVTGGGAYKYKDLLTEKLNLQVEKEDEMSCLITGCNFVLKNIRDEVFIYHRHGNPEYKFESFDPEGMFPYVLVNIGSGVSIVKVESETKYERIGGTSLGGGSFWGLGSILTKAKGFDELLQLADSGDHRNVDMLVKDIYGGAYCNLGLPAELIASSFGKAARSSRDQEEVIFQEADVANSLLKSMSNDIGQIATLHARLHGLKKIYFAGYFIRGHPMTMHTISFAVNYWSKGDIQAYFLRHEGYLGAIGAFLKSVEEKAVMVKSLYILRLSSGYNDLLNSENLKVDIDNNKYSWTDRTFWGENFAGSSGLQSQKEQDGFEVQRERSATFDMLELDKFSKPLVSCPLLLDPTSYTPDTVDLTEDEAARVYWLQCFEDASDKFSERAVRSQPNQADAESRARKFRDKYVRRLHELQTNPCAYGNLTVRGLLDTREHCLAEFKFVDPYSQQKQQENEHALRLFPALLEELDALSWTDRQLHLAEGMLAGNVFDWGAKEVANLMEQGYLGFSEARKRLQTRPWLMDDFDSWLSRLQGPAHRCAVIFVDNSGFDIILGIFPFVRELVSRGTKVILCANSHPALNDVTYNELTVLTRRVAACCAGLSKALDDGRLQVMESGQGSPCLDLRYIDSDLAEAMRTLDTDLVVLEGMGRSIHTNFTAVFQCEALKVAVLKNKWLANRLGGEMFSVVFKYEESGKVAASGLTDSKNQGNSKSVPEKVGQSSTDDKAKS